MRNDIYPINHLPPVIPVGIQSEHGVREVRFDVSPWLEVWPGMYCEVWNTRPGESEAYRTVSVMEGDILTWNVNEVDTEKEGLGKVEIVGMTPDGERKKHAGPVDTAVKATSIAMTQEMPESHVPYYEALMASNADAKAVTGENARVAQEAALKAQEHKLNAGVSEENAKIYMNTASEKAKESAESAVEAAASVQDSRKAAEDAGQHSNDAATSAQNAWEATKKMPIVGENGNWYVWSPSTGSYTDSGVPAQGPEGEKEMFFVTITTGSNGKLTSTQSYGNILYADQEGKFIVGRLDGAWPLEFVGSVEGGVMFRHIRCYSANANEPTICAEEFVVKPNGEVTWSTRTWKAPNPHPLTITGATSATYDGSSAVTLDVPDVLVVTTSVVDGKSKANYTSEEFRAAYHNNIALLKMDQVCYIFSGYESRLPKFARPAFVTNMNRIRHEYATIGADGFITRTFNEYGIRNPSSLVFTGAVNATYDGGSRVTVHIPAGGGGGGGSIPDPGTAHQQLVSDADGKAVWDDRTHYTEYTDVVVLEQTTLPVIADEGMAYLTEAPIAEPTDGGEYNVKWNGADYTCKAAKTEMDGIACVMIGNAMAFGGDDTGEPFVALFLPADTAAALGAYAMIVPLDGSAEIVLSISGKSEVVHKLHEKYLPNLPTNLVNGSTPYSLRQKSAAEEDAEYMLGSYASAFGYNTKAIGQQSHAEGTGTVASGDNTHAEGWDTKASSISAHAEGLQTTAEGNYSHAEGAGTVASGDASHAEGRGSKATAESAHAEGAKTTAEGDYSHAEGKETTASKESAHAEGNLTTAEGNYSHAEGDRTVASGSSSHAEGHQSVASGIHSHAEGSFAKASGATSHAEGSSTIASGRDQHVQGRYNVEDTDQYGKYAHIVGNGKDINNRSNAHTLDWEGNAWFAGDVYVGGDGKDDGERLVKASEFSALSEENAAIKKDVETLKGGSGSAKDFTTAWGAYSSSGEPTSGASDKKGIHTSIMAIADIESAVFAAAVPSGSNFHVCYFDENENFAKRVSRAKEEGYPILTEAESAQYPYFSCSWYRSTGVDDASFRALMDIKFKEQENVSINHYVKNDMTQYRYAMPKWADIHPWQAFEGVTNAEVNEQDFNTWYGRFHALTETHAAVGLEEINMSTEYLAANTDDSIPAAITDLTNGGMYMWHLPAPMADGSGLTVKHKTPKIVIVSGQHGDETSSIWCVWKLLDALCRNDAEYRAITLLRNFCDIYIIPLANPYGIEEFTRVNENGVNINRDYAVKNWIGNSTETGAPTAANSQYSTRCISWWIGQIVPDGLLDLHASFGSNTSESGMFVQWGGSAVPAIASLVEENIMDVTPYIRKNLAPKFDSFQHWFGHTSEITEYRKKLGMLSNYAIEQGILAATYEVVRRVQWNDVFILSGDDEPSICAMNYHGIVNFIIKFAQMVVETLNSGVEWQTE